MIAFTMFFSGGLIPTFLVVRNLGLIDTYAAMILPWLVSPFHIIIMRSFFMSLPSEVEESAMIDGAGYFKTFFFIVLPLSKPVMATVGLWLAVSHWNSWFDVLIYITDESMFTLPIILRRIIVTGTHELLDIEHLTMLATEMIARPEVSTAGLRAAAIFVTTIPILCVYPFIQKYFVQGTMLGSLKE